MDLAVFLGVLWRQKLLVLVGLIAAGALAYVAFDHRGPGAWQSSSTLFVTQQDFPWGRAVEEYVPGNVENGTPPVPIGDPTRLTNLALLYAQLANGDAVQRTLATSPYGADGSVVATAGRDDSGSTPLPLITITATATTPEAARSLAGASTETFLDFLKDRQDAAGIPKGERVSVEVLSGASGPELVDAPSNTLPILVFLGVVIATVALAFVIDNLRRTGLRAVLASPNGQGDREDLKVVASELGARGVTGLEPEPAADAPSAEGGDQERPSRHERRGSRAARRARAARGTESA